MTANTVSNVKSRSCSPWPVVNRCARRGRPAGDSAPGRRASSAAPSPGAAPGASPAAAPDGAGGSAEVGQPARLDFTLKNLEGADVPLSSFKGKAILINFWATWCEPCRDEIPDLVALHHEYGDRLTVVGILVLDPVGPKTKTFVERFKMDYPVLNANDRTEVEDAYGPMIGLPTSVLVTPDGRIAARYSGPRHKEQFEQDIKMVLQ